MSLREGQYVALANTGLIKFGTQITEDNFKLVHLPFVIISGAICGLLGALFVIGNTAVSKLRKRYLQDKWLKVLEAVAMVCITGTIIYVLPLFIGCSEDTSTFPNTIELVTLHCN